MLVSIANITKKVRFVRGADIFLVRAKKNQFKEYFLNEEAVYSSNKIFFI